MIAQKVSTHPDLTELHILFNLFIFRMAKKRRQNRCWKVTSRRRFAWATSSLSATSTRSRLNRRRTRRRRSRISCNRKWVCWRRKTKRIWRGSFWQTISVDSFPCWTGCPTSCCPFTKSSERGSGRSHSRTSIWG